MPFCYQMRKAICKTIYRKEIELAYDTDEFEEIWAQIMIHHL
jgi:hypothetical protein